TTTTPPRTPRPRQHPAGGANSCPPILTANDRYVLILRGREHSGVASAGPPKYERRPVPTSFSPFEPRVRAMLAEFPEMSATVIAERVDWQGSISWFRDNARRLRPQYRRPDPADRLSWAPGDAAQCDLWFPPAHIPLEDGSAVVLPVLVITTAHSRFTAGRMIPTRKREDLLLGSWELIRRLGRVPRRLIWDNEAGSAAAAGWRTG
ncbi:MAG: hypothetical protein ACLQDY_29945, partial [Streptosporangiaceae bacterium]